MATTVKAPAVPPPVLEKEDDDAPRTDGHRWHLQLAEFPDLAPQGARLINGVWYALHPRAAHLWRKLSPVPGMPGEWRGAWQTSDPGELFHRQFEHRLDGKVREHWRRISPQHDKRERLLTQFPHLASKLVDDLGPKPDKRPGDAFPIGERILVHATVLEKCSSNWRSWLDRHAAADFGEHGTLCEPGEIARWLSSAASTAEANSLAIERGSGLVTSRYRQEDKWGCEICTLLFPGRPAQTHVYDVRAPGFIHKRPVVSTRGFPGLRAFYPPEFQPSHVQGYADRISTWFEYLGNQRDLPGYLVLLDGIRADMKKEEAILEQSIERALAFLGLNRGGK